MVKRENLAAIAEQARVMKQWDRMLHGLAYKALRRMRGWYEYEDLLNSARLALWKAHLTFKEDLGVKFQSYATRVVINRFNAMAMLANAEMRRTYCLCVDMDEEWESEEGGGGLKKYQLTDGSPSKEESMVAEDDAAAVRDAFRALSPKEQFVLRRRVVDEDKLEEIGTSMNVSRERVRQIEQSGLRKLAQKLEGSFPSLTFRDTMSLSKKKVSASPGVGSAAPGRPSR